MNDTHGAALPPMTRSTCMCLYVVLFVNKFHYWVAGTKRTTYIVKPSLIVQEKWLCHEYYFCMLKENDVIMKLFLTLWLLSICMYTYASWICVYVVLLYEVSCFTWNFCVDSDYVILLYPALSFNKADWFYLQFLPVGGFCTVIRIRYLVFSLLGFWMYICMYIWISDKDDVVL